jgi:glycosyltransferase involved in cell wall biosynthesis
MNISYGITVCNEHAELENLITHITPYLDKGDEIVVVYDQNRVTPEVLDVLEKNPSVHSFGFDFQQNFLENKNFMNSKCKGDYIFQIDADEIPQGELLANLKAILDLNEGVDVIITPRKNLVEGLTPEHIQKWNWHVNSEGWVNWPDPQKRIYRNDSSIQWSGHMVHGMVEGYKTYTVLPFEEEWCILHNKTIDRQESQNDRYAKIETGQLK